MSFASASAGYGSVFRSVHPFASSETIFDCLALGFVFLASQRHGLRQATTAPLDAVVVHSRESGEANEAALSLIHRGKTPK